MKKILFSIVYLLIAFGFLAGQTKRQSPITEMNGHARSLQKFNTSERCGTMQHMEWLKTKDPGLEKRLQQSENRLQKYIQKQLNDQQQLKIAPVYTLPLVVHIIYKNAGENLSDAQVFALVNRLNEDFRRLNADTVNTPNAFLSVAADMEIDFCLARQDPGGNPTNGIVRVATGVSCFTTDDAIKSTASGGSDSWDTQKYFNIWLGDLCGNSLGYGEFPTGPPVSNTFGAVQDYCNSNGTCPPYDMNRTMVHELSHCFNLVHIWADDGGSCSGSDLIGDTPNQADYTFGCPAFPRTDACSSSPPGIMYMNYMDYSDDACMNMFTQGQKTRARAAIDNFIPSLLTSNACQSPTALDAGILAIISPAGTFCADSIFPVVTLRNYGSNTLTSVDIEYQLDGGPTNTFSWTGNLTTGTTENIVLPSSAITAGAHTFTVNTTNPNGGADDYTLNDASSSSFTVTTPPAGTPVPLVEGFEGGTFPPSGWVLSNGGDQTITWERTTLTGGYGNSSASTRIDNYSTDIRGDLDALETPYLDFTSVTTPIWVKWDWAYARYDATYCDSLKIYYSTNCGNTWNRIYLDGCAGLATTADQGGAFVPTASQWASDSINIDFLNNGTSVVFRFENKSGYGNYLYLDNINIYGSTVTSPPTANFSADLLSICAGGSVNFTDNSTNNPTSWSWTFNGGTPGTSTNQNPTVTYNTAGNYDVSLTATNASGSDTKTNTGYITVFDNSTTAGFSYNGNQCLTGNSFNFTNTGSSGLFMGVPLFNYAWTFTGGAPGTSTNEDPASITYAASGTYSVEQIVTEVATGCTDTFTLTVTIYSEPTASITGTDVSCNGACDGSADLTSSGGTTPYTWLWSNLATSEDISSLCPSGYSVTATDSNSCTTTASITIAAPAVLAASITGTDELCPGICDGEGDLTVTGGTTPYTYSWSNGPTTEDVTILCAGSYTVTVTDLNSCTTTASITIGSGSGSVTAGFTVNDADQCLTGNSFNFTNTGSTGLFMGFPLFNYAWTFTGGAPGISTNENPSGITYAASGTFSVEQIVTEVATGCIDIFTLTITIYSEPSASITGTDVSCNGVCDGSADLTSSGGTVPYTWSWSNLATSEDISSLCPSGYSVTITDSNSCTTTASITITEPAVLSAGIAGTDELCSGNCDGEGDLTVTGGTAPYFYSWSNGPTTEDITSLCAGSYTVTVTDSNSCTTTASVTISSGAGSTASFSVNDAGQCLTGNSFDFTNTGSTTPMGAPQFSYAWIFSSGSPGTSTAEDPTGINWATTGTFIIRQIVTQISTGCTDTFTLAIIIFQEPTASIVGSDVICNGVCDGLADLTASGGTAPYTWLWSNLATSEDISSLCASGYSVTVTDSNGCTTTASITISEPPVLTASITGTNTSCNSVCDGEADLTVIGGTLPYTHNWSNGETTEDITTLCAGIYTDTITDTFGCTTTATVTISEPPALATAITGTDASCNGTCDGAADLTVLGGTSPYTYLWSNSETTQDIGILCADTYIVNITDTNGCTISDSVIIGEPTVLSASITGPDVSCNGECDGAADMTVTGGTSPYNHSWSNGDITEDITGLCTGTYTDTITDANGCTVTEVFVITEPAVLTSNISGTDVNCNGACDGTADLTVSGGKNPYTCLWSTLETIQDISGLCPGTYTVDITDSNGCTVSDSVLITEPSALSTSITGTNATCFGVCDGSADLTVTGGTSPYTHSWSNGETTEDIASLCAATYTDTIIDDNGCINTESILISEPPALAVLATGSNVICNGACDGQASTSISGGTSPYSYQWDDSSSQTTAIADSLCAGTYKVVVTDGNGCQDSASVIISEPLALTASTSGDSTSCNGLCDGQAIVAPSGGTIPYIYQWNDPSFQTTDTATGLCVGTFNVTVTDSNECIYDTSYTVNEPLAMTLTSGSVDATCNTANGEASVSVSGGTSPYTYLWSPGGETTDTITSLTSGAYVVVVTDTNLCNDSITISVNDAGAPIASIIADSIKNVACNGGSDGSVTATGSGGVRNFAWLWSPTGGTDSSAAGLVAGIYTITITDDSGCVATATITITEPALLTASITSSTNVACNGDSTGVATVSVSGGVLPYTYSWAPYGGSGDTANNLIAGTYSVTVTDSNSCDTTASIIITEPLALSTSITGTNVSCNGICDGSADLIVSDGTSPYTFLWSNTATIDDITNLCADTFDVTVTDNNGCTISDTVIITEPAVLTASLAETSVSCNGVCDGEIDVTVTGGTFPYTHSWSNGSTTENLTLLCANAYSDTITDTNGCTITESITITEPAALATSMAATNVSCNGACDGAADLTIVGGTMPYAYSWSNGDTIQDISGLCTDTYVVTVTDTNLCTITDSVIITEPLILSNSINGINVSCNGSCDGAADLTVSGGTSPYTFLWSNGATIEDISSLCTDTFDVTVTDANLCTASDTVIITEPLILTVSIAGTNVTCNSACDGSADLTVTEGTAPYTYLWSTLETTQNISGLCAATFNVTVTDTNGCTSSGTIIITEPPLLSASLTDIIISCNGFCDGAVDVTVTGGTSPYNHSWSNGAVAEDLVTLCAGTYSDTITDTNGCVIIESIIIIEPAVLATSITDTNVSCNIACDGSADLTVVGGTIPYDFSWSNGDTTQNIIGLCPDTFIVTVTDSNGCTIVDTSIITEPLALTTSISGTIVNCNGSCDGSIDLTVSGGTPSYTFTWSNGPGTEDITGLCADTFSVIVTDANNCTASDTVIITEPLVLTATISDTDATCSGCCDGSVDVTVSGGTIPYSHSWTNGDTIEDISGLCSGSYCDTITDLNGCTVIPCVLIAEPNALVSILIGTNLICNGVCDGAAGLTVSGGVLPYTFSWSNGDSTKDLTNLCTDTFIVTITDSNGISISDTVIITEPSILTTIITGTNVNCNGTCDGEADLTVLGGTPGYTYAWSNGATVEDITNLCADTFNVTITDANLCAISDTVIIIEPLPLTASIIDTNVSCNGICDGSIDMTVSGGTAPYSHSWSNGATIEDLITLCTGTYSDTITDTNGCVAIESIIISEPASLATSITGTNVSCNLTCDGSADLIVFGGTTPYEYSWSNGPTVEDISGLCPDTFIVTVTDSNGCTIIDTSIITEPLALTASVTGSNVSCNGTCDGSADLTVSGGTPSYTFDWSNGSGTEDITGLCADSFSVVVTDANNCSASDTVIITEPVALTATITNTNSTCNGACDGAADLTVSGGTLPYSYTWSGGDTTEDLNNVCAGIYIVNVTEKNGCTVSDSIIINEPPALISAIIGTDDSCSGACAATADLTVSGGVPSYTFSWSNSAISEDLSGLCAGTYTVAITDVNNCVISDSVIISEPSGLTTNITGTNLSCNNVCDGAVNLTVSGGTVPYTYSWSNGDTINENLSGLCAGNYSVIITDSNGCTTSDTVIVTEPPVLTLAIAGTNLNCNNVCDGIADLTVTGGTLPYSYFWSNGAIIEDIAGLCAFTYSVTVTDVNGCTTTDTIMISEPTALVLTMSSSESTCDSSNGSTSVSVTGGSPGYTYVWDDPLVQTNSTATGLPAEIYTVIVTDSNGCVDSNSTGVSNFGAPTLSYTFSNVSCNGSSDGSINLTVSDGTLPFTFNWSNGDTTEDISGLTAGIYSVSVNDSNNCPDFEVITINEPASLNTVIIGTNTSCNGDNDGTANLTVTGGTTTYTYLWSNGSTTEDLTNLSAGTYSVIVTDANSCTANDTLIIGQPPILTTSIIGADVSCNGANDGTANLIVTGGTTPYTYIWSNGSTTEDITILSAGTYSVIITDANSCTANDTVIIDQPLILSTNIIGIGASCYGVNNGTTNLIVTGGTTPYIYLWSTGSTTEDLTNLSAGTYSVIVTDANSCTANDSILISEPTALVLTMSSSGSTCDSSNGSTSVNVTGGTPGYTYIWDDPLGQTNPTATGLSAGIYNVIVTDNNGCVDSNSVGVNNFGAPILSYTFSNVSCNGDSDGSINLTLSGSIPPFYFSWSNADTTEDINGLTAGIYSVTVTDTNGCIAYETIIITEPTILNAVITSSSDVNCNGDFDGLIDLTVIGGMIPYSYTWSNGATTEDLIGIPGGSYNITVADANGCTANNSVIINEPAALSLSVSSINATCGNSNGSASVNVNGGITPYTYQWDDPLTQTNDTASGLIAGLYSITVTDNNNCIAVDTIIVYNDVPIAIITFSSNTTCNGLCDGTAVVSASNGVAPYTYLWDNGETTAIAINLCAGSHSVTVTDSIGCFTSDSITILEPAAFTAIASGTDVSCFGACDGDVSVSVSGGFSPYNYCWDSCVVCTAIDCPFICAGTYTVIVTDANGCTATDSVTINEQPKLIASITSSNNVSCYGDNDGSAVITANGGIAPYTYLWNDTSAQTNDTAVNLIAGNYIAAIIDNNGCVAYDSINIYQPAFALNTSINVTSVNCNGDIDGSATLTASGGTSPYTYLWSNGSNTEDLTGISANTYTVIVSDSNGCTANDTAIVSSPSALVLTMNPVVDATCDSSDGSASVSVIGGTPGYNYLWNDPSNQTTSTATELFAGIYTVVVTDSNGCVDSISVGISSIGAPNLSFSSTDVTCNGDTDGSINISIAGGTPPLTFSWSNGDTIEDISNLSAGTYSIIVTDSNNCPDYEVMIINQPAALTLTTLATDVSCFESCDGEVSVVVSGGSYPYNYMWDPTCLIMGASTCSGLCAGIYYITITDSNGCVANDSILIAEPPALITNVLATNVSCNSDSNGTLIVSVTGGNKPYNYLWLNSFNDTIALSDSVEGLSADIYSVLITDNNSCTVMDSLTITEPPALNASITNTNISCYGEIDGTTDLTVSGGIAPYSYFWSNFAVTEDLTGLSAGTYEIIVTDSNSCTTSANVTITEPPAIVVNTSGSNISCYGICDGTASANVTGGIMPYTYSWNTTPVQTTANITGLCAQKYFITVTDGNECVQISSITLSEADVLSLTDSIISPTQGNNDGAIILTVSGSTLPYTFSWSNGDTTQNIFAIESGNYSIVITDANGCTDSAVFVVTEITGINQFKVSNLEFRVYPNPTTGHITYKIVLSEKENISIEIYNVFGEIKYANSLFDVENIIKEVDLSIYSSGIYFVKLVVGEKVMYKRIVIAK